MRKTWRKKGREEKLRRWRVPDPQRKRNRKKSQGELGPRINEAQHFHGVKVAINADRLRVDTQEGKRSWGRCKKMEIGQSKTLLDVSCGLFYLQSSVKQHLSNQIMQMLGRRHPTHRLLTKKVIITYLTNFLSFLTFILSFFFFFNGHVTCLWDLSFLDRDWAHVPCTGNAVLTIELPGKCHI